MSTEIIWFLGIGYGLFCGWLFRRRKPKANLTDRQKKIVALALFSQAMRGGPQAFKETEELIKALDIEKESADFAMDFIEYTKQNK